MAHISYAEEELDAITCDLSLLFKKFDEKGSLRFEDFCEVWREMRFSFIHSGQRSMSDRTKSVGRLLRCTAGFFNPETPFQYRVAAIYAAYAIYYTQLAIPKVKIRMTVTMWKDFKDLHELIKRHQHLDIDYIITKLENDKAFQFTAMSKELEYGKRELMANLKSCGSEINLVRKFYQPDQYVESLVQEFDVVEKLAYVDEEYNEVKEELKKSLGPSGVKPRVMSSLNMINDEFRAGLVDDIEEFREWLEANTRAQVLFDASQRPVAKSLKLDEVSDTKSPAGIPSRAVKAEEPSRHERIKALKLKSFRNGPKSVVEYGGHVRTETIEDLGPVYFQCWYLGSNLYCEFILWQQQQGASAEASTDQTDEKGKAAKPTRQTFYRRSAIIEKREPRVHWREKTKQCYIAPKPKVEDSSGR